MIHDLGNPRPTAFVADTAWSRGPPGLHAGGRPLANRAPPRRNLARLTVLVFNGFSSMLCSTDKEMMR